ncbi:MAG: zinc ribbon domain-containing protein [Pseudomonadota bacterium]
MPIYDYHCKACDQSFELLMRRGDKPVCPECKSEGVEKLISATQAPGKSRELIARARRQAAIEGHFSNHSPAEKRAVKRSIS